MERVHQKQRPSTRQWARGLLVLGAVLIIASPLFPYWRLRLKAPQYPKGLQIWSYPHRVAGDVAEIDGLNHYIGMRKLEHAAETERSLALGVIATVALGMLAAAFLPGRWPLLLLLPALLFPLIFPADLQWWLRDYGLNLDPKAALSRSIKPFVPPVLGTGKIGQFYTFSSFGPGYYMSVLAAAAAVAAAWLRLRRPRLSGERKEKRAAPLAALGIVVMTSQGYGAALTVSPGGPLQALTAALEVASDGDTIEVRGGVHPGPIVVRRSVRILGADGAVIDGGGAGTAVTIEAPRVELRGFTVRGTGSILSAEDSGIVVAAPEAVIEQNRLEDVLFGIHLRRAPGSVVRRNVLSAKDLPVARRGDLIRLWYSDDVVVEDNEAQGGRDVVLWFSKNLLVRGNDIEGGRYGLHFMYCHDSTVTGNRLVANSVGAFLMYSHGLTLKQNRIVHNRGPSGYGIGLKDMEDSSVTDNLLADNRVGIFLEQSQGRFEGNFIAGNDRGVLLFPSATGNVFTANSFLDNNEQLSIEGAPTLMTTNQWKGNFWSDYRGFDADGNGVGDLPYRPLRLFERISDRQPGLRLLAQNPSAEAIDLASRLFPVFEPHAKFEDPTPLMRPLPAPLPVEKRGSSLAWLLVCGGFLTWPLSLLCGFRGGARSASREVAKDHPGPPPLPLSVAALKVEGLTKRFGKVTAVDSISFEVQDGEAIALWGPNGAGKTTILRCLLGVLPFRGGARVHGIPCGAQSKASRERFGYVPQEVRLHGDQTVHECVRFYARLRRVTISRAEELLSTWGLTELGSRRVRHLSGGMRQKLALVIALLSDPPVLLLDEPTSNFDTRTRREFGMLLERLKKAGKTLIFCSHRSSEVLRLADRVIVLESGKKIAEGRPDELREHLLRPASLTLMLPPERCAEAAALLSAHGFAADHNDSLVWVETPAGRRVAPLEALFRAGVPLLDLDLEEERGSQSREGGGP